MSMIQEVRRQFHDIPALKRALEIMNQNEGKASEEWTEEERNHFDQAIDSAEYGKCVEISTQSAIKEMVLPGMVAILTPVAVGLGGNYFFPGSGAVMLGGLLAGVTAFRVLMAPSSPMLAVLGTTLRKWWRKVMRSTAQFTARAQKYIRRQLSGTVGDPLKDTSGPSLNILLKLMSVVALVLAPYL